MHSGVNRMHFHSPPRPASVQFHKCRMVMECARGEPRGKWNSFRFFPIPLHTERQIFRAVPEATLASDCCRLYFYTLHTGCGSVYMLCCISANRKSNVHGIRGMSWGVQQGCQFLPVKFLTKLEMPNFVGSTSVRCRAY